MLKNKGVDLRVMAIALCATQPAITASALDGCDKDKALDGADEPLEGSGLFAMQMIESNAVAAVQAWAETTDDDLDDGEGFGDRLFALFVGIADENLDGEISEDEADIIEAAIAAAADYMTSKGVSEEDITALIDNFDNDVALSIHSQLEVGDDDMDSFMFGDGAEEAAMDATYKRVMAIRGGVKKWIKKRIAGTVRLSAKQKFHMKKLHKKVVSSMTKMRRKKSMAKSRKMGLS